MTVRRISHARLDWLAERCCARDKAILRTLSRLRLVSGGQLERLHFSGLAGRSRSVSRWKVLQRLTDWQLIAALPRRVGGSARGSAGMVYRLDSAGARLLRLGERHGPAQRIRRPTEPGERKVKHSLEVSELYAGLIERSRLDGFDLPSFDVEPHYRLGGSWMSPDAYAVLTAADVADHWWIEVDRATESPATIQRKFAAYVTFYQQGRWASLGVMPRVLVAVPDEQRRKQLAERLTPEAGKIVEIVVHTAAVGYIARTIATVHG